MAEKTGEKQKMEKTNKQTSMVKKEKKLGFNWFFWISFIIILVPVCFFGYLLKQASEETRIPVNGTRITDTVTNEISQQQVADLQKQIESVEGIEKVSATLTVQTLRITVDSVDTLDTDGLKTLANTIYEEINKTLPIETYFTRNETTKQYDIEITVYDNLDNETPNIISLVRNAADDDHVVQVISAPVNQTLTDRIVAEQQKAKEEEAAAAAAAAAQQGDSEGSTDTTDSSPDGGSN